MSCFMERTRPLPIGCPLDRLEPVKDRDLRDFEWLWVDAFCEGGGYQHQPDQHRCYDGPHLYPLDTVLFLTEEFLGAQRADVAVGVGADAHEAGRRPPRFHQKGPAHE